MITNAGRVWLAKAIARGGTKLSAVAIGDGAVDETLTPRVAIAPAPEATVLVRQIFFDPRIQAADVVVPDNGSRPRIVVRHTFDNTLVPSIGRLVTYISEFGVFGIDPDTQLYVLVAYKTFDPKTFRVPVTGRAVLRDSRELKLELPF